MSIYQPYTYFIYHRPTGLKYYGCRYTNQLKTKANPDDFWVTYFTSSKKVHKLIEEYGKDSFDVEVRKVFNDSVSTLAHEQRVLTSFDAANDPTWLNSTNGFGKITRHGVMSEAHRKKIGDANRGRKTGAMPEDIRARISASMKGKPKSREHAIAAGLARRGKPMSAEAVQKSVEGKKRARERKLASL
jgi:hypothetical protein